MAAANKVDAKRDGCDSTEYDAHSHPCSLSAVRKACNSACHHDGDSYRVAEAAAGLWRERRRLIYERHSMPAHCERVRRRRPNDASSHDHHSLARVLSLPHPTRRSLAVPQPRQSGMSARKLRHGRMMQLSRERSKNSAITS